MKSLSLVVAMLILCSCATTMPGNDLNLNSKLLSATVSEHPDFSNDKIKMYQIAIKNLSNSWIDIDSVLLEDTTGSAVVLVGPKMNSWIEASKLEKTVSDYNTSLLLGSLAIAGAVVGGTSGNDTTSTIGYSFALGALTAAGIKDFVQSKNKVEFLNSFPETHLFHPFVIPSQKVIQRWIIVENPNFVNLKFVLTSKVKEVGPLSFEIAAVKPYVYDRAKDN